MSLRGLGDVSVLIIRELKVSRVVWGADVGRKRWLARQRSDLKWLHVMLSNAFSKNF